MRKLSWVLCFVLIGCGGESVEDGTNDTGQIVIDTGQVALDSGAPTQDSGVFPTDDAGDPGFADSGLTPAEDAGPRPRPDTGGPTPRPDAGGPPPRPDVGGPQPVRDAGGGGGGGGQTCIEVMQCTMRCQDQACMDACVDRARPGAHRRAAQAMMQCTRVNDCANAQNTQQCMMRNCMQEAQACGQAGGGGGPPGPGADGGAPPDRTDIGPPPSPGDGGAGGGGPHNGRDRSCSEALGCVERCGQNNMQCIQDCFGGVAQASQPLIDAIFNCMGQNRCGMDFTCATNRCPAQIQACRNDR